MFGLIRGKKFKMIRYRDKYRARIPPCDPRTDRVTGRKKKGWKEARGN